MSLSLLRLRRDHRWAVLEYGMRGLGEIQKLCEIAAPDIAVLTVIGESHLERLNSLENIVRAKSELVQGLKPGGIAVLNADDPRQHLLQPREGCHTYWYGITKQTHTLLQTSISRDGTITIKHLQGTANYRLTVPGSHNRANSLAAATVGLLSGVPLQRSAQLLADFQPSHMRSQLEVLGGTYWINDAYNASPTSMMAALAMLADQRRGGRTIAVLGDMLELGEKSPQLHAQVGGTVVTTGCDILCTIGVQAQFIAEGAIQAGLPKERCLTFGSINQAVPVLKSIIQPNDVVLLKGSRGMQMERVLQSLAGNKMEVGSDA